MNGEGSTERHGAAEPGRIHKEISKLILSGEFGGGDKITELGIASRLNVGRGQVREAFRSLEEAGMLRMEKNRGVFVRNVGLKEAADLHEVRSALDEHAARRSAGVLSTVQLKKLAGLVREMDGFTEANDVRGFYRCNLLFHSSLIEWTGNEALLTTYRRLVAELHLYRQKGLEPVGEMSRSNADHRAIMQQIAAGNGNEAARIMREHTGWGRQRILLGDDSQD